MTDYRERLWEVSKQRAVETLERTAAGAVEQPDDDPLAVAMARPVEDTLTRDRRWFAERDADWQRKQEAEREREAESKRWVEADDDRDTINGALVSIGNAIELLSERLDVLEQKQQASGGKDADGLRAGLDRLDGLVFSFEKSVREFSRHRRFDPDALPLPNFRN